MLKDHNKLRLETKGSLQITDLRKDIAYSKIIFFISEAWLLGRCNFYPYMQNANNKLHQIMLDES